MIHNLTDFKSYPTIHRWLVRNDVFSVTANLPIMPTDILQYKGKQYLVLGNYKQENGRESTPKEATLENVNDTNLQFINTGSIYYELLTQQI
jgi:hypothetical protein